MPRTHILPIIDAVTEGISTNLSSMSDINLTKVTNSKGYDKNQITVTWLKRSNETNKVVKLFMTRLLRAIRRPLKGIGFTEVSKMKTTVLRKAKHPMMVAEVAILSDENAVIITMVGDDNGTVVANINFM